MTENHHFSDELEVALGAADAAASVLVGRAGADDVREKGRADLVTAADEEAERTIERLIREAYPNDGFVAEEFSARGLGEGRNWIVDPLDGTVNYVHRHPFACVSIALVDDNGPAVAVVNAPFLGEVYSAVRGGGSFLNARRLTVSHTDALDDSLLATGFPFKPGKGDPTSYMELVTRLVLRTHGVRRAGAAALDLAFVARGAVDGYFEIGLSPWDVAAGILLVTEAGGKVSGWPGDRELALQSGRVLATNGRIHDPLYQVLGEYRGRL